MIIVLTYKNKKDNNLYIDYGINTDCEEYDKVVILPQIRIEFLSEAKFNCELGEYVIE